MTPEEMARVLVSTFPQDPREDVAGTLRRKFPELTEPESFAVVQRAQEWHASTTRSLDEAVARDERAAVDAEHDTSRSMHRRD